jgi:hypothetical protein
LIAFLLAFSSSVREYILLLPGAAAGLGSVILRTLHLYPVYLKLKRGVQAIWLRIGPNPRGPLAILMLKLARQREEDTREKSDLEWASSETFHKESKYEK